MAFIYDRENSFENFVNPSSIIWQPLETEHWKNFLKENLKKFVTETQSSLANKIINDYENEHKYFKQVCPIEMLDKLDNPITLKSTIKKVS
jgi:glutamate synthase (NADPH/NADH) large chain